MTIKVIDKFYGGMVRDEKSKIQGACSNIEEMDIFSNEHFIQAEQILSADSMPASTEIYAKCVDNGDVVYGYGKETGANKVRLVSVASGGTSDPGAFATLFTSADTTDLAYAVSPIEYHRQDNGNKNFLYYCTKDSTTIKLKRFDIVAGTEHEDDAGSDNMTLSGLDGSYDRIVMERIAGELYITNGQYIAKVDKDGVFTNDAYTLPNGWEAVDIISVSDVALILARSINRNVNESIGYWWDLTTPLQFDDKFNIPFGGPQWMVNHKETIKFLCAINGKAKFYQMPAYPGSVPVELPGLQLENVATETATQSISPAKTVDIKDNILYFGLWKTDKTGVYAIGQLDSDKPTALILSRRFHTTNYANHKPTSLIIQGPNFYADFDDNGTASSARCETLNSPNRSSNAVYESIVLDDGDPATDKPLKYVKVTTKPMTASTDVDLSIAPNYGSYTEYFRADGTSFNTTNSLIAEFDTKSVNCKCVKIKLALTSSTTNSPKITGLEFKFGDKSYSASK